MSRSLLVVVAVALAAPLFAQPKDEPKKEGRPPVPLVQSGDTAPPFAPPTWLSGKEVKAFEKDKIYVLDFSGTVVSGGLSTSARVLSDLHDKSGGKGLAVVGVITPNFFGEVDPDPEKSKKTALEFLQPKQPTYPIAWDADKKITQTYISKVVPLGVTFVVDQEGKVAYAGSVGVAAHVAEQMLAGSWKGKASLDAIAAAQAKLTKLRAEFSKKYPPSKKLDDDDRKALRETDLPAFEAMYKEYPFLLSELNEAQARLGMHIAAENDKVVDEIVTAEIARATKHKAADDLRRPAFTFMMVPITKPHPGIAKTVEKLTASYLTLRGAELDKQPASLTEWILINAIHGNDERVKQLSKKYLDAIPEKDRQTAQKQMEDAIKQFKSGTPLGK